MKFKAVVWYPRKRKFITLESNISRKDALRLSYAFKGKSLPILIRPAKRKLRKVV